jgi:UDP-N-acetylglucosamine--N-acetylmuramyl-(pentapeptide) pyrophosphoryl-undecaprenol N-acetylglucosamine transferase
VPRTFLIAAGGTGGHLFPGIAVADELRRRHPDCQIAFAGTRRGLETRLVPRAGYALHTLPILPLNGVGLGRFLLGVAALPFGLASAALLLLRSRPHAVLGVGGYAGGPLVLLAALFGVRTVILEPNAVPGFTNRVLRRFVDAAACTYEETTAFYGRKARVTGNPVRSAFFTPADVAAAADSATLLVFGGSQGSQVLNEALVASLGALPGAAALRIVHQTGERMQAAVAAAYQAAARPAEVVAFLDDMPQRLHQADLVVSRSGATTCAELCAAGRAAVLVPFAAAADDHQKTNALAMVRSDAAVMVEEKDLGSGALAARIGELVAAPAQRTRLAQNARGLARPDAAARVADLLEGAGV